MIGIQLLIFGGLLALICVGAYFYSQKCIDIFLIKEVDDLEYILDTEGVPARWCLKYAKHIERIRNRGASEAKIERVKKFADHKFQHKMKRMIAFAKGAPIFESDNYRNVVMEDLRRIGEQWKRREFMHDPY